MFGPLNGVRTGLVIAAAITGVMAAIVGQWAVTAALGAGVVFHGLGWFYLYQRHQGGQ